MSDSGKNQAVIGAFVVGAVVLAIIGVIVFGSGKMFQKVNLFVMYFEGSVKGLNIGAPVTFRGVKIGSVVDITLRADPKKMEFRIPVVMETEKGKIEKTAEFKGSDEAALKKLIDLGLRARLDMQSMVTGQLLINLEMLPDEPARLSGTPAIPGNPHGPVEFRANRQNHTKPADTGSDEQSVRVPDGPGGVFGKSGPDGKRQPYQPGRGQRRTADRDVGPKNNPAGRFVSADRRPCRPAGPQRQRSGRAAGRRTPTIH
jgi:hypothetical protein